MSDSAKITPVILCGGAGTRLWPSSRDSMPKQFTTLTTDKLSTFQSTVIRVGTNPAFNEPIVIAHTDSRFIVAEQLAEIGHKATIILEPCRRDSAAAVATAALYSLRFDERPLLIIMAADHLIRDVEGFRLAAIEAAEIARNGAIMTFGIKPSWATSGFGYIRPAESYASNPNAHTVASFVEKPLPSHAQALIEDGALWNSGYFLFTADKILAEFDEFEPKILASAREALEKSQIDLDFVRLDQESYSQSPSISFDYAVMEKTKDASVLKVDFDWSDLGTWEAIWAIQAHDEKGNVVRGRAEILDTSDSLVYNDSDGLTAVVGLENVIVITNDDVVLVASKSSSGKVKDLVSHLREKRVPEADSHRKVYRPWGWYQRIDIGDRFQVKRIAVKPGGRLSLQKHFHRAEHWVVVKGTAAVTLDGAISLVHENEAIYLPIGATHRLENPGKINLELIEVQVGSYTGEDDIIRIEDVYGRIDRDIKQTHDR